MTAVAETSEIIAPVTQLDPITPIAVKKQRAPKHDFKDGQGRVFAHKHDNGKGWVADTAKVDDSVYVGPRCSVFNFARVSDRVRLEGRSKIGGHSCVSGNVVLKKDAHVYGRAIVRDTVQLTDHAVVTGHAIVTGTSQLRGSSTATDRAQVLHSCLSEHVMVSGDASVVRCNISGSNVQISGRAIAIHATMHGIIAISGYAQVLNSTLNSQMYNHLQLMPIHISDFAVIADNSQVLIPLEIKNHAIVVRSTFGYSMADPANNSRHVLNNQMLVFQRRFNVQADLQNFIQSFDDRGNSPYTAVVVTPARGPVPVAAGPRRVMRLQETGA
ncbi:MAG: hypothetical protein EBZ69_00375 [Alphaproteobacteria bacterium]|nr:hypothetical protein [Alphaproteobacteria bacterium]